MSADLLTRTMRCGEVSESDAGTRREVVLTGWVHRRRDLGQLVFVELRDGSGRVQVVFDPSEGEEAHALAETLRLEDVLGIAGVLVPRESPNPNHPTGQVEVRARRAVVHNRALTVPFPVDDEITASTANEEARL